MMRNLLITSMPVILWIMTVLDAVSIRTMFSYYLQNRKNKMPLLVGIICIGLFYDSLILALGALLQPGAFLKFVSQFRYILHCTMIPLLFPVIALSMKWKPSVWRAVWAVTIVIMILGLAAGICLVTEPRTVGAINRYAEADATPGWVDGLVQMLDIVPVFIMIGAGVLIWIKKKNPHLFFAGFFMLLFTLLGIFLGKDPSGDRTQSLMFYISMYGEALMVYFLLLFIKKEDNA